MSRGLGDVYKRQYYGFAKEGELEEAGAEYIVNEVKGILDLEELKLLLNKQKQL